MVSDWEKGNSYQFEVKQYPEHPLKNFVTNGKYSVAIKNSEEAMMVCNLLNEVMIGNGDGISERKLKRKIRELFDEIILGYEMSFVEKMMVENIFNRVWDVINDGG